jgi:hypothetical protein
MDHDLLQSLLTEVDKPVARLTWLESYYYGNQQNGYLTREQRDLLGRRLSHLSVNIPKLAITSLAERLSVRGFKGVDIWPDWLRNDGDQIQDIVHREALCLGESFVIVWADAQGRPTISAESAWQMAAVRDPGTREIAAAIKRWEGPDSTEAVVFLPDKIYKLRARNKGAKEANSFHVYEELDNPLGVVPVVVFTNSDRFAEHGVSEIDDLADLVDGLNLALADLAIAQAYNARPVAWATGVTLEEKPVLDDDGNPVVDDDGNPVMAAENPFPPTNRMHIAEPEGSRFGQLDASNLEGFSSAVRIWLSAIQAVTSLPSSQLGILSNQPDSADALRAASQGLEAKAQNRGATFGRSWEMVGKLVYAVSHPGTDVSDIDCRVVWRDFGVNSFGAEADGVTKLFAAGLLSRSGALARLGFSQDEILAERAAIRAESLDAVGVSLPTVQPVSGAQRGAQAVENGRQ